MNSECVHPVGGFDLPVRGRQYRIDIEDLHADTGKYPPKSIQYMTRIKVDGKVARRLTLSLDCVSFDESVPEWVRTWLRQQSIAWIVDDVKNDCTPENELKVWECNVEEPASIPTQQGIADLERLANECLRSSRPYVQPKQVCSKLTFPVEPAAKPA